MAQHQTTQVHRGVVRRAAYIVPDSAVFLIKKKQILETREEDVLQETGYSSQYDPEIVIENQCDRSITVSLNDEQYWFDIGETKTIIVPSGQLYIFASSPGVIPFSTSQYVSANHSYEWQFYIKRERRRR